MQQTTALIILNYNNSHDTRNCIESILKHNTARIKFIVVDNASRDEEFQSLRAVMSDLFCDYKEYTTENLPNKEGETIVLPYVTLLESGENIGFARGNNMGLELAYADPEIETVMMLNNDILFVEDIIPQLLEKMKSLPDCGIISPVLYKKGLKEYDYNCARTNVKVSQLIKVNFMHYLWQLINYHPHPKDKAILKNLPANTECLEIELPSGSCMLANKDFFRNIGSFDPNTFLYFEENILYKKISAANRKNYLLLNTRCIHLGASTTSNISDNKWLVIQSRNSEKYYVSKYSDANALVKAVHSFSVDFYMAMYSLQKKLKKK